MVLLRSPRQNSGRVDANPEEDWMVMAHAWKWRLRGPGPQVGNCLDYNPPDSNYHRYEVIAHNSVGDPIAGAFIHPDRRGTQSLGRLQLELKKRMTVLVWVNPGGDHPSLRHASTPLHINKPCERSSIRHRRRRSLGKWPTRPTTHRELSDRRDLSAGCRR